MIIFKLIVILILKHSHLIYSIFATITASIILKENFAKSFKD